MYTVGRFNRGLAAALLAFLSLLSVADAQTGSDTAVAATACGGAYQNPVVTENCSTPSSSWKRIAPARSRNPTCRPDASS